MLALVQPPPVHTYLPLAIDVEMGSRTAVCVRKWEELRSICGIFRAGGLTVPVDLFLGRLLLGSLLCWPKCPVAYALRAPQTSVSATLLRQTEWRYPGLAPANSCTITTPGYARRTDRVGISGPTGDLGTAMAWLRPVALLQSSPPFGEWRGSGGKGPVLGWLLCSDAISARSDEPEGGLTKPGRQW
eukprot:scaffold650_cov104-Phaeocystis_antarctica.AAC.1